MNNLSQKALDEKFKKWLADQNIVRTHIELKDCYLVLFFPKGVDKNIRCPFWITGVEKASIQPCECIELKGYCYCEFDGHGEIEEKLFNNCPFKESIQ